MEPRWPVATLTTPSSSGIRSSAPRERRSRAIAPLFFMLKAMSHSCHSNFLHGEVLFACLLPTSRTGTEDVAHATERFSSASGGYGSLLNLPGGYNESSDQACLEAHRSGS